MKMPFVQRQIEPKYIARRSAAGKKASSGSSPVRDNELETITNLTLSNAMRQLASLLALSKEIFTELNKELEVVSERSTRIKSKLTSLQQRVDDPSYDAKLVVVRKYTQIFFSFLIPPINQRPKRNEFLRNSCAKGENQRKKLRFHR